MKRGPLTSLRHLKTPTNVSILCQLQSLKAFLARRLVLRVWARADVLITNTLPTTAKLVHVRAIPILPICALPAIRTHPFVVGWTDLPTTYSQHGKLSALDRRGLQEGGNISVAARTFFIHALDHCEQLRTSMIVLLTFLNLDFGGPSITSADSIICSSFGSPGIFCRR